jgi:hypothetical protein
MDGKAAMALKDSRFVAVVSVLSAGCTVYSLLYHTLTSDLHEDVG